MFSIPYDGTIAQVFQLTERVGNTMAVTPEELPEVFEVSDRDIMLQILDELVKIRAAFNENAVLMQWMVDNTKSLFSFVEQIQANGGPSAILGMMGRGNG